MRRKSCRPLIVGVTGSLGTGKTTVANMFKALGARLLDADKLAHKTFKQGASSYKRIVTVFGRGILDSAGNIDRTKLAQIVFRNKRYLKRLCNIVHPPVIDSIMASVKKMLRSNVPAVVIDAPLLIEAGLRDMVDYLVVVKTSRSTQIKRTMKKTKLTTGEITRRIKHQMPLSKKIRMADFVIDNGGTRLSTKKIVKEIWKELNSQLTRSSGA